MELRDSRGGEDCTGELGEVGGGTPSVATPTGRFPKETNTVDQPGGFQAVASPKPTSLVVLESEVT